MLLAIIVLAVYVVLPQFGDFRSSWHLLGHARSGWTALAIGLSFTTYVAAAGIYYFLAFKPLLFGRTLLAQFAATFVNRLLPAGIGALGANYLYLRHERHTGAQAASVVTINNLLGFVGHMSLVFTSLLLFSARHEVHLNRYAFNPLLVLLIAAAGVLLLWLLSGPFAPDKISRSIQDVKQQFFSYRRRPGSLGLALASSMTLTLCNVFCLLSCGYALGFHLPFIDVLLILTLGVGAGAATPTPGGLGGFEAGLAAGFVVYGADPGAALAVALLYRLASYWLPLFVGAGAFVIGQRRGLFKARSS